MRQALCDVGGGWEKEGKSARPPGRAPLLTVVIENDFRDSDDFRDSVRSWNSVRTQLDNYLYRRNTLRKLRNVTTTELMIYE